ncbi:MAG TPA: hypothetical protein VFE62_29170 [Gemmataceae bacterium]|nr:hypothetical protein [Gemmataceae bacterium]
MSLITLANRSAGEFKGPPTGDFEPAGLPKPSEPANGAAAEALNRLVEYLPIETVAVFWLAVPAAALLAGEAEIAKVQAVGVAVGPTAVDHPSVYDWIVFFSVLAATPILLLLQFLSQVQRDVNGKLPGWRNWPWWRMLASTLAFGLWAMAVPGNPFLTSPGRLMAVWAIAAVGTAILGYLDKILRPATN